MIPALILSVGMLFFPESPRWLIDHNRNEEALQILADVHGKGDANADLVRFVLSMVAGSGFRLQVQWQNALEVPRDESNRVGTVVPCSEYGC